MKTLNTKLIVPFVITLLLTGCMPDSLTKFKKDAPKKSASTASGGTTVPPLVDDNGNAVDPVSIIYPTKFYFISESVTPTEALVVGASVNLTPTTDGTLADPIKGSAIFVKCEIDQTGAVITRTLPPGLTFSAADCKIGGTPSATYSDTTPGNVGKPIPYTVKIYYKGPTYTGVGTESTMSASINIGVYAVPNNLRMSQNANLQIKINSVGTNSINSITTNTNPALPYDRYGVITSSAGVSGIVKYVDSASKVLGVHRIQPLVVATTTPFTVNGFVSTAGNVKVGKILAKNSTTKTLYVEAITANTTFAALDAIDNVQSYVGTKTTVTSVDNLSNFRTSIPKFDNDTQYYSERFDITDITQTYETGVAIDPIAPLPSSTLTSANDIVYSISPALPAGLSFDTTTGTISGTFSSVLSSTAYTITATNLLGSASVTINLSSINAPKDLSYTTRQVISVNSNTLFLDNENIFQPITPPLSVSVKGKILKKVSINYLSIETYNGPFLAEASLDSGNAYYSEKSYIPTASVPNYYNVALTVGSTIPFAIGNYVSTAAGAKGRVIFIDSAASILYIQFLTPDTSTVVTFSQGDAIDNVATYVAMKTSISEIEAQNIILTMTNPIAGNFQAGDDITSSASLGAYVYTTSGANALKVDEITRIGANLKVGQSLDRGEYYNSAIDTIAGVSHDNLIVVDRGVSTNLLANLSQDTSVIYSVSPSLPSGLTLNTLTGSITGTATVRVPSKNYVITATNLISTSSFAFNMEVRDYLSFSENSGAKSFLTHKIGDSRSSRNCRINATDILAGNTNALDIGCNIEAEELDLFYTKLKLSAGSGPGNCEYIGYTPFSFWQYTPYQTTTAKIVRNVNGCGIPGYRGVPADASPFAATIQTACDGNYQDVDGPNCDEGKVTIRTYTTAIDSATGLCNITETKDSIMSCGGSHAKCVAGPINTVFTEAEINAGKGLATIAAASGATGAWDAKAAVDSLSSSNLVNANTFFNNSCTTSRADAKAFAKRASLSSLYTSPLAQRSPFYEFTCLDSAKDIKARIRLVVRDWDRSFKINGIPNKIDNPPALMDVLGVDGFGVSYNNVLDWDDDYTGRGVSTLASCSAIAAAPSCSIAGECTDGVSPDQATCQAVAGPPTASWLTYPTRRTCEAAGGTWLTNDYQYPSEDL